MTGERGEKKVFLNFFFNSFPLINRNKTPNFIFLKGVFIDLKNPLAIHPNAPLGVPPTNHPKKTLGLIFDALNNPPPFFGFWGVILEKKFGGQLLKPPFFGGARDSVRGKKKPAHSPDPRQSYQGFF